VGGAEFVAVVRKYVINWEVPADFSREMQDQASHVFGKWSPAFRRVGQ
jgi:hypothetical protein